MDVNLKKTATDTAYIVVGVGVLGFQQAQVRRRDTLARVAALRRDARGTFQQRTDRIKARTEGCAGNLGSTVETVGSQVRAGAEAVGSQVKAGADIVGTAAPRGWVEPVVGDIRVRVEPVVEQLRTIALPGNVSALPDQVSKVIEVGRNRVQGRFGGATPTAVRTANSA